MGRPKRKLTSFADLVAQVARDDVKRRLKAAFRRKKRPARVRIPDDAATATTTEKEGK